MKTLVKIKEPLLLLYGKKNFNRKTQVMTATQGIVGKPPQPLVVRPCLNQVVVFLIANLILSNS